MIDRDHCHRFACSVMLELGSGAPIAIKWPAAVLVIWPHFNGNEQRLGWRPALFSSRISIYCMIYCFLCTSHGYPRGKSNPPRGCTKLPGHIACFLVGSHWRFSGLLACTCLRLTTRTVAVNGMSKRDSKNLTGRNRTSDRLISAGTVPQTVSSTVRRSTN